jgi:uncharacterized protein YvpB
MPLVGGNIKTAGSAISKNIGAIQITKESLKHVVEGHAWNSTKNNSSKFFEGIDPVKLVNQAAETKSLLQKSTGNYIRNVESKINVGIDRVTNSVTNTYTVVTKKLKDGTEKLITTFPSSSK